VTAELSPELIETRGLEEPLRDFAETVSTAVEQLMSEPLGEVPRQPRGRQAVDGATFVFREPAEVPAVWGKGEQVCWAQGEGLLLVGPDGVGKSTLQQQLICARIGLRAEFLEMSVTPSEQRVLYIAADRPRQAARSFRRMVSESDEDVLGERLVVWEGPLPFDLTEAPRRLAEFVRELDVHTVFIDSLKDVALDLSKDEVGSRVNLAFQELIADGVELCASHHQRKEASGGGKPRHLSDVYGSRWLTAGMGSVLLLWGEAGDPLVELLHLKQPAEEIGPLWLQHDHLKGVTSVQQGTDLAGLLGAATHGLTVADAGRLAYTSDKPSKSQIEKCRRRLEALVSKGHAERRDDPDGLPRYFIREAA
jgi:replicative DNA helicase